LLFPIFGVSKYHNLFFIKRIILYNYGQTTAYGGPDVMVIMIKETFVKPGKFIQHSNCSVILTTAVEPRHTISDYARSVVALGEIEHQTAGLSEPAG
jgi:hypothetical protein